MSTDSSVSKGVFVFKNGFERPKKISKNKKMEKSIFSDYIWYQSFTSLWRHIEEKLLLINVDIFSSTQKDLINFVKLSYVQKQDEIPTAALLTGINMSDHDAQFTALTKEIKENVTPHCIVLNAEDCSSIKMFVENMIYGFLNDEDAKVGEMYEDYEEETSNRIKKSLCNFEFLEAWYNDSHLDNSILVYSDCSLVKRPAPLCKPLVVIMPDVENFSENVIQDFISIVHSHINDLPFVLIFGVSTSLDVLHRMLPYHVSSKISIKVFSSQSSTTYLNNILENVFFTGYCPFSLSGNVFNLLTDIFLFYDLSVTGFVKHFKFAMMQHFSKGNEFSLCTNTDPTHILDEFTHEDLEGLRQIYSFRDLVEKEVSYKNKIKLLKDDDYLKGVVLGKVKELRKYIFCLHLFIRCLHILVTDLPKTPLGKQIRELYAYATSKNLTKSQHFKEFLQLLNFQSKDQLYRKLTEINKILEDNVSLNEMCREELNQINVELKEFLKKLEGIDSMTEITQNFKEQVQIRSVTSREEFKKNLKSISKSKNIYEKLREDIIQYLHNIFEKYLVEYSSFHFHEIFFFDDIYIQNQIIGTHRSAIHEALNDPQTYLQCTCCEIKSEGTIIPTMPDVCIAYKLHLECGKMINLYDWLQAFLSILDPTEEEEENGKRRVDPELQARFTQAVAELEYLGFIKSSKRKTDHVQRLTWGG